MPSPDDQALKHVDMPEPTQVPGRDPARWPELTSPVAVDTRLERQLDDLLSRLPLEQKVGQLIQADHTKVTPADVRDYFLGAVLNGGNSVPGGHKHASVAEALAEADSYWLASMDECDGRVPIPIVWGTDAVHGHNNMVGTTIFPHNIGLGAARNPDLVERVGQATALEVAVTGLDWTFAPAVAVTEDVRWGRIYESYSSDPALVASLAARMVVGLQGPQGQWSEMDRVLACAKHFIGDGGTEAGIDQGDTRLTEQALIDRHGIGYFKALTAGVQTVMASFSSWNGEKLHGHRYLLTDILKGRLGFDGFVVGDWNGHGQVPGCSNTRCAAAINAGVDMLMAPDSWRELYTNTLDQVRTKQIPRARVDDAVRRILRVKLRMGLFAAGQPSGRRFAGKQMLLANPEHRSVARQAARESLVLLKNHSRILPLNPGQRFMVAGTGADNIGQQCGGWTLSWQGTGNVNGDFPNATSIYRGIEATVAASGGSTFLSIDGSYQQRPDVAIVVFGEEPYAEFQGDVQHVGLEQEQQKHLSLLQRLHDEAIPIVVVLLTGRPLWTNPQINLADAFVVAWLPGSEGGNAVADLLLAASDGRKRHDFTGRLPFPWPSTAFAGGEGSGPQFPLGYGLNYSDDSVLPALSCDSGLAPLGQDYRPILLFTAGKLWANLALLTSDRGSEPRPINLTMTHQSNPLSAVFTSRDRQDDSMQLRWSSGLAALHLQSTDPLDISGVDPSQAKLVVDLRLDRWDAEARLWLDLDCGQGSKKTEVTDAVNALMGSQWQRLCLPLSNFQIPDQAFLIGMAIHSSDSVEMTISRIAIESPSTVSPLTNAGDP